MGVKMILFKKSVNNIVMQTKCMQIKYTYIVSVDTKTVRPVMIQKSLMMSHVSSNNIFFLIFASISPENSERRQRCYIVWL